MQWGRRCRHCKLIGKPAIDPCQGAGAAIEQLQDFKTPAGAIYAVALLLFAAMPMLVNGRRQQQP